MVTIIIVMWAIGFFIAAIMPLLFFAGLLFLLGVIGAVACMCFSGGGACMGCMCANDIAREDDGGGGKVAEGGAPAAPEVDLEAAEPAVAEEPVAAEEQ